MARVIRIDDKQEKEVTHKTCGAVIGYYRIEVKSGKDCDYTGSCDNYDYIICPHCGKEIRV